MHISSCTSGERAMRLPLTSDKACFKRVNIPRYPANVGVMIRRMPIRCLHFCVDHLQAVIGIADKDTMTLASRLDGRCSRYQRVSIS